MLLKKVKDFQANNLNMVMLHIGRDTPELRILEDMNSDSMKDAKTSKSIMSQHRQAELDAVTSKNFLELAKTVELVNYRDVVEKKDLKGPQRSGILYESRDVAATTFGKINAVDSWVPKSHIKINSQAELENNHID